MVFGKTDSRFPLALPRQNPHESKIKEKKKAFSPFFAPDTLRPVLLGRLALD
jgi:hypothetical protein